MSQAERIMRPYNDTNERGTHDQPQPMPPQRGIGVTGRLDFNRIASIAVSLQELAKDRSAPVHIEGDIIVERPDGSDIDFLDMDEGEAARRVVETVLEHPHVQELFAETDRMWEALKWLVCNVERVPIPPNEHTATIEAAIDASGWDEDHPSVI